jgi:hypothetical protein
VEKLTQDVDFLQSEIGHLSHAIADINKEINAQTYNKKALVIRFIKNHLDIFYFYRYLEC